MGEIGDILATKSHITYSRVILGVPVTKIPEEDLMIDFDSVEPLEKIERG